MKTVILVVALAIAMTPTVSGQIDSIIKIDPVLQSKIDSISQIKKGKELIKWLPAAYKAASYQEKKSLLVFIAREEKLKKLFIQERAVLYGPIVKEVSSLIWREKTFSGYLSWLKQNPNNQALLSDMACRVASVAISSDDDVFKLKIRELQRKPNERLLRIYDKMANRSLSERFEEVESFVVTNLDSTIISKNSKKQEFFEIIYFFSRYPSLPLENESLVKLVKGYYWKEYDYLFNNKSKMFPSFQETKELLFIILYLNDKSISFGSVDLETALFKLKSLNPTAFFEAGCENIKL